MIRAGQQVTIKPEWQDDGDQDFIWTAITDENPHTGYFKVRVDDGESPSVMEMYSDMVTTCAPAQMREKS